MDQPDQQKQGRRWDFLNRIERNRKKQRKFVFAWLILLFAYLFGMLYGLSLFDPQKLSPAARMGIVLIGLCGVAPIVFLLVRSVKRIRVSDRINGSEVFEFMGIDEKEREYFSRSREFHDARTVPTRYPEKAYNRKFLYVAIAAFPLLGLLMGMVAVLYQGESLWSPFIGVG